MSQLKRLLTAIVAICYLCVSTGFTLYEHYCMGQHVSTSLQESTDSHSCERCGMEKGASKNGCCKDKHKVIKADSHAAITKAFLQHTPTFEAALPLSPAFAMYVAPGICRVIESVSDKPHGPPGRESQRNPIYLRVRSFLI